MSSAEPLGLRCELISGVEEACVDSLLVLGKTLGKWAAWNQCQSFAAGVLRQCRSDFACHSSYQGAEGAPGTCKVKASASGAGGHASR